MRGNGGKGSRAELAKVAEAALAYTESLDAAKAVPLWEQVSQAYPDDLDLLQNLVIAHYLDYASRVQLILGDTLSPEEQQSLRQSMASAYAACERPLQTLQVKAPDQTLTIWLSVQLPYQRSRLLPAVMAENTQTELTQNLAQQIAARPEPALLGLLLEYTEQSDPTVIDPAVLKAMKRVNEFHGDNLCIGAEYAKRQLIERDQEVIAQVDRLATLCQPMAEELQRQFGGESLDDFVNKLKAAITQNDWNTSELLLQSWINVMTATQAWRTDQHRLHPHILDFLVLKPVYDLLPRKRPTNLPLPWKPSDFQQTVMQLPNGSEGTVRKVILADVDLDEREEWIVLQPGRLCLFKYDNGL